MNRRQAIIAGLASTLVLVGCSSKQETLEKILLDLENIQEKVISKLIEVKNPIKISSYEDFQKIGRDSEYPLTANYVLTQDIDCKGDKLEQIGDKENPFSGTFNGLYGGIHRIFNFVLGSPEENDIALFYSTTKDSKIANLELSDTKVNGNDGVVSLVSKNKGNIMNCSLSNSSVDGNSSVGGLVCTNFGSVIDCYINKDVEIEGRGVFVGSIVVNNKGNLLNCYMKGNVNGNSQVGGVVAVTNGVIKDCYSDGKVIGAVDVGGIAGYSQGGIFINCPENKNVKFKKTQVNQNLGTLIGFATDTIIIGNPGGDSNKWIGRINKVKYYDK